MRRQTLLLIAGCALAAPGYLLWNQSSRTSVIAHGDEQGVKVSSSTTPAPAPVKSDLEVLKDLLKSNPDEAFAFLAKLEESRYGHLLNP